MKKMLMTCTAALLSLCAFADTWTDPETGIAWTYTVTAGEASLDHRGVSQSLTGAIEIPSRLGGYPVTSIGSEAFIYCIRMTSVTIPEGVTSIGDDAFYSCSGLMSVSIPSSVVSIGDCAFACCGGLMSHYVDPDNVAYMSKNGMLLSKSGKELISGINGDVTIPDGVTSIVRDAFSDRWELTSIKIPSSVTNIGGYAFEKCRGLTSVTIPEGVIEIGDCAFRRCYGLTSVIISSSVTSVGSFAFEDCSGLTSVAIPSSVTSIGGGTFSDCSGLTSVTIPSSVTSIGNRAFYGCSGLTSVTIPSSVTSIGSSAFYYCSALTSVTIPSSVTNIGSSAFCGCGGLTSVVIPEGVASIAAWTFDNCSKLTSITIPSSVINIERYAFRRCSGLTNVLIPDGVASVGDDVFCDCTALRSITLPTTLESIGDYCFSGCSALTQVYYCSQTPPACSSAVYQNTPDTLLSYIPWTPSTETWCGKAWTHWDPPSGDSDDPIKEKCVVSFNANGGSCAKTSVEVNKNEPIGVLPTPIRYGYEFLGWFTEAVGGSQVFGSSAVQHNIQVYAHWKIQSGQVDGGTYEVVTGENMSIEVGLIGYKVTGLPSGLSFNSTNGKVTGKASKEGTFEAKFTKKNEADVVITFVVKIPEPLSDGGPYVETVDGIEWTFMVRDGKAIIGDGLTGAIDAATTGAVFVPSTLGYCEVASIGDWAFVNRLLLTSVTLPASVTRIGEGAFSGCSALTDVTLTGSVNVVGIWAFANCTSLVSVVLPFGVTDIGPLAFLSCESLSAVTIPKSVTSIVSGAFDGCGSLATVYVDYRDEERVREMLEDSGFDTTDVTFLVIGDEPIYEVISGAKTDIDVGLVGYKATGLPKGLTLNAKGHVTGTTKSEGEYEVTFTKKGEEDETAVFVVRKESAPTLECEALEAGSFTVGVAGAAGGMPIAISAESGVKSVAQKNLPTGMKLEQDKTTKQWRVTGAPTKAGPCKVKLTVTTVAGNKVEKEFEIAVATLPDMVVGTFNGFVSQRKQYDAEFGKPFGAIQVTTTDGGKITAKITAAAKTYSFSATCWDEVKDGVYSVNVTLKTGEALSLMLDSSAGWDVYQLTGRFSFAGTPSDGSYYELSAQRNAFGKTWYFDVEGSEADGWRFSYADNPKTAALTLTLNADGKTSIAGKLGDLRVSASGYSDVSEMRNGCVIADFAPVVTVMDNKKSVKMLLAIRTNLWFDRSNDHELIGSAELVR